MFLTVLDGPAKGRVITLDGPGTVGRDPDCALVLDDERVSRQHATFTPQADGTVVVSDLGSTNGVFVGSERLTTVTLRNGDSVRIGRTTITVRTTDSTSPATVIDVPLQPNPPAAPAPQPAPAAPAPATPAGGTPFAAPAPAAPVVVTAGAPSSPMPPPPPGATTGPAKRRGAKTVAIAAAVVAAAAVVVAGVVVVTRGRGVDQVAGDAAAGVLRLQREVDGQATGAGTAWVYDSDNGLIVTSFRSLGAGTTFSVEVEGEQRPATIVGASPCDDLAVLRVDGTEGLSELPLGDQSALAEGDEVVVVGYPESGTELASTTSTISNPRTTLDSSGPGAPSYADAIQSELPEGADAPGGLMLNGDGDVVGVSAAGAAAATGTANAIGADRLGELLPELAAGDSSGWSGFVFQFPASPAEVEALGYDRLLFGTAVFVTGAVAQSPAASTNMLGRLGGAAVPVLAIDGTAMDGTLDTLCTTVGSKRQGDTSELRVTDGRDIFEVSVTFA
jgi:pSer/pThr/pTyr-binding forkhead associated (FHA) protein